MSTNNQTDRLNEILTSEQLSGNEELLRKAFRVVEDFSLQRKDPNILMRTLGTVAIVASDLNLGAEPVLAVFLKDAADHLFIKEADIIRDFGASVYAIITGLQKIDRLDTSKYSTHVENFIRLLLTLSDDIRVILIRLAQRLQDIRSIEQYPESEWKKITGEISALYVPIAHRIGLYSFKTELEDRVMKVMEPEIYQEIEQKLIETREGRDSYTAEFIRPIEQSLREHGFDCEIKSRVKSIPSIRRKMLTQKVEFEKVYDLFAIRIIINNSMEGDKADCWKIYSLVTDIYTPNPRRLRDWISFPKSTGYESLHTTVIGPEGKWVEVQIRTRRMDDIAERSFAAHWKYKSGTRSDEHVEFYAGIREMLENPVETTKGKITNKEKEALYTDEIFIFTPKGDLKRLKAGYSVLDFAWEIHTDVGATCTGAIVNGKIVPIKHILKNGDTVKIRTSKNQKPNHSWLEYVKSPRVISRIKHALKMETYKESEWGKEIIKNKVTQMGMEFNDGVINKLVSYFECENFLDLYQRFGEGKLDPLKIKKVLAEPAPAGQSIVPAKEPSFLETVSEIYSGKQDFITIDKNINSIHYQFAHCCNPIPGDKIFAFVSVTKGIKVHKTNCPNAHELITRYPYRVLEARWKVAESAGRFTANFIVTGNYKENVVDKLTKYLTNTMKVNIRSEKVRIYEGNQYSWEVGVLVTSKTQLDEVTSHLKRFKEVTDVRRTI